MGGCEPGQAVFVVVDIVGGWQDWASLMVGAEEEGGAWTLCREGGRKKMLVHSCGGAMIVGRHMGCWRAQSCRSRRAAAWK